MRRIGLLFVFSLLVFPGLAQALTCVENNQDQCEAMGYNQPKSACPTTGIGCPFDPTKWLCPKYGCADTDFQSEADTTYWSYCDPKVINGETCYNCYCEEPREECAVGDVYFANGTCASTYSTCMTETPIGVVFWLTDQQGNSLSDGASTSLYGRIIALDDVKIGVLPGASEIFDQDYLNSDDAYILPFGLAGVSLSWGYGHNADNLKTMLQSYQGKESNSTYVIYDGQRKTDALINTTPSEAGCFNGQYQEGTINYLDRCYPSSAWAVKQYYPDSSLQYSNLYGQGQWYLPSIGELVHMFGMSIPSLVVSDNTLLSESNNGNKAILDGTLQDLANKGLKARPLNAENYYSIDDYERYAAWIINEQKIKYSFPNKLQGYNRYAEKAHVRPILKFNHGSCLTNYNLSACPAHGQCSSCRGQYHLESCDTGYIIANSGATCQKEGCAIGDIFYSDGTCSPGTTYDSSRTPVGVVYMLTDASGNIVDTTISEHGRVINLKDLAISTTDYRVDSDNPYNGTNNIPLGFSPGYAAWQAGLTIYTSSPLLTEFQSSVGKEGSSELYDGKGVTQKLATLRNTSSSGCASGSPYYYSSNCAMTAAIATLDFYPLYELKGDSTVGAGQWYLPAFGELVQLYGIDISSMTEGTGESGVNNANITKINSTLQTLKDNGIEAEPIALYATYYRSSTLYGSASDSWVLYPPTGSRGTLSNTNGRRVRASLQF